MSPEAPGLPTVKVVSTSLASASPRRRSRGADELGRVVDHRGGRTACRVAMRLVHCGRPPESDLHALDGRHAATGSHRPRRNGPTACETGGQGDSEGNDHPEQLWCGGFPVVPLVGSPGAKTPSADPRRPEFALSDRRRTGESLWWVCPPPSGANVHFASSRPPSHPGWRSSPSPASAHPLQRAARIPEHLWPHLGLTLDAPTLMLWGHYT